MVELQAAKETTMMFRQKTLRSEAVDDQLASQHCHNYDYGEPRPPIAAVWLPNRTDGLACKVRVARTENVRHRAIGTRHRLGIAASESRLALTIGSVPLAKDTCHA